MMSNKLGYTALLLFSIAGCASVVALYLPQSPEPTVALATAPQTDCSTAKNTCADYSPYWLDACPQGSRCITFVNQCTDPVALAYQVGCNGDGTPGAPQCNCTTGPTIPASGGQKFWEIVDADYTSCLPSWKPACLTAGLAVIANEATADCTKGTRVEFTAGNQANDYNHFDSYDIDVEKDFYSLPVHFAPDLTCAVDHANHDCRPLWCGEAECPDAYGTPTTGDCADKRSPQAACQDTFGQGVGYTVTFCPTGCTSASCPSCEDAKACP